MSEDTPKLVTVDAECDSCDGTGLYCGFCEPKGTAVVCLNCNGTGCMKVTYRPFVRRKGKKGVNTVSLSRGSFIATGVGAAGKSITYHEFASGKMPTVR